MPPRFDPRFLVILGPLLACDGQEIKPTAAFQPRQIIPVPGGDVRIATPTRTVTKPTLMPDEGQFVVEQATGTRVGIASTARIRITPAGPYHINTDYPFTLTLDKAEGITVNKSTLSREDAETLVEKGLVLPIAFTPLVAGTHRVTGSIQFGICRDDSCLARSMPVTLEIEAT